METQSVATLPRKSSHPALRALLILLVLAGLGAIGLGLWAYSAARASLPQIDGTIAVAGLSAPVKLVRDRQGVPHITAASVEDLIFAQGYVTAQDRLWQMDVTRRYAAGDMSELLGRNLLVHDRRQRVLGLRHYAAAAVAAAPASVRGYTEAYARGVNAFIDTHRDQLTPEFRLLHYSPAPWKAEDSLLVGENMHQLLNFYWVDEMLARERVASKLGPELAAELYPNSSWRDHPPGADAHSLEEEPGKSPSAPREAAPVPRAAFDTPWFADPELVPGSNNWVVSGAHTASGKPLLSNDMHLPHQIPNVWYEAHLEAPGINVTGVTLPGVPFVIVGHNQRIAWGFTNLGPAVTDLFVESFRDDGQYLTPEGWKQPEHRQEVIHIKGEPDETLDVVTTRHGPIITPVLPGESRKLALKWVLYDPAAVQGSFYQINTAQNWPQFLQAFSQFGGPSQNVVYGDVDGHIGYHATGLIPIRASGTNIAPVSGIDNSHEWTGYVPFDKLPWVFDPPSGILATANGRITPDGYPYYLSGEWGGPQRTERIYHVLQSGKKFTAADMLALQTDICSDFDHFLAERLVYAVDHNAKASPRARQAADILRAWDGRVTADSVAPNLTLSGRRQLTRMILESRLGAAPEEDDPVVGWRDYHWFMSSVWLETLLMHQPQKWLPPNVSTYDELLAAAVEATVQGARPPKDLNSWHWAERMALAPSHPIFGSLPFVKHWAGPGRHVQSGNGFTVKQVGAAFGPSERFTVDFSNLDASTLNIVNGQSGHILSPHFNDQWNAWYSGTTFNLPYSDAAVAQAKEHELMLTPAR